MQLRQDALLVNPYDLDGVAEALRRAVGMSRRQRQPAMYRMQRILSRQDVHWWANQVLQACEMVKRPSGVPIEMDIASQEHPS